MPYRSFRYKALKGKEPMFAHIPGKHGESLHRTGDDRQGAHSFACRIKKLRERKSAHCFALVLFSTACAFKAARFKRAGDCRSGVQGIAGEACRPLPIKWEFE